MNAVVEVAPKQPQLPVVSEATALIQAIERAALNPQVDIEKMERLFAMQKEIMARQAETEFNAAMAVAQSQIPTIKGHKKNTQTGSFYADLVAVCDVAMPIITKHGFSLSFSQGDCPIEGRIRINLQCAHARGHSRHSHWDAPIDTVGIKGVQNKTQIHGEASSFSYAQRYLTKLAFNLRIEGEDNDGNGAGESGTATGKPAAPADYEDWQKHMGTTAKSGIAKLQEAWNKTAPELRDFATQHDVTWWKNTKTVASKVQP